MATLANGQNLPTGQENNPSTDEIYYLTEFFGDFYDPEEHIKVHNYIEQHHYKLVATDADFALYLDYPIYKTVFIDNKYLPFDMERGQLILARKLRFSKTLFDMSDVSNYIKLKEPKFNDMDKPGRIGLVEVTHSTNTGE